MKIALVSPYDFAHPGGVCNHITALERRFTRWGHDVRVIAPALEPVTTFGDRFIPIGKPFSIPSSGSVIRISISLHLAPEIKTVLKREQFDVIHLHEPFMPMLCSAMLRFSNAVNIGTFHACRGSPGYNFAKPITTIMIRRRLHKLDGRIAVSGPAMEFASKHVPGYYTIIPNGIDIEHFSPDVPPFEEFRDGKKNILFVGRLEYRKGLNYLLRAYLKVKQEIPDSRLIVVGPGTVLRRRYEKWIKRHELEDVVFIGYAPFSDLPRYYKTADVFCAPSTGQESFGIVLLEAMSVGTPVVATSIDGYAGVISPGEDGLLVPPRDEESLAQTLVSLLDDKSLQKRLREKGLPKARTHSWDHVARQVFDYYLKIIEESPWGEGPSR